MTKGITDLLTIELAEVFLVFIIEDFRFYVQVPISVLIAYLPIRDPFYHQIFNYHSNRVFG